MKFFTVGSLVIAVSCLVLAGCARNSSDDSDTAPPAPAMVKFGLVHTWPQNQGTIAVSPPQRVSAHFADANGKDQTGQFIVLNVTVTNNSTVVQDPLAYDPLITIDRVAVENKFIPDVKFSGNVGSVLPGQSRTFALVLDPVPGAKEIQVETADGPPESNNTDFAIFVGPYPA